MENRRGVYIMKTIEIFFQDDSELAEFEARNKGYRTDVYVKIENVFYNVRVYELIKFSCIVFCAFSKSEYV